MGIGGKSGKNSLQLPMVALGNGYKSFWSLSSLKPTPPINSTKTQPHFQVRLIRLGAIGLYLTLSLAQLEARMAILPISDRLMQF